MTPKRNKEHRKTHVANGAVHLDARPSAAVFVGGRSGVLAAACANGVASLAQATAAVIHVEDGSHPLLASDSVAAADDTPKAFAHCSRKTKG